MVSQSEERKEISFYKMEFQGWINSIHSLAKVYIFFKFYFIFFKFYFIFFKFYFIFFRFYFIFFRFYFIFFKFYFIFFKFYFIFFKFYFIFFKFYFYVLFDIKINSNPILKLFKNID
jgi:hypothetical protein